MTSKIDLVLVLLVYDRLRVIIYVSRRYLTNKLNWNGEMVTKGKE